MIEALAIITFVVLLVAVYMTGYTSGIARGHKLIQEAVDYHNEVAGKAYESGQSSMQGWKTEVETQRKQIARMQNYIQRELRPKKEKKK